METLTKTLTDWQWEQLDSIVTHLLACGCTHATIGRLVIQNNFTSITTGVGNKSIVHYWHSIRVIKCALCDNILGDSMPVVVFLTPTNTIAHIFIHKECYCIAMVKAHLTICGIM